MAKSTASAAAEVPSGVSAAAAEPAELVDHVAMVTLNADGTSAQTYPTQLTHAEPDPRPAAWHDPHDSEAAENAAAAVEAAGGVVQVFDTDTGKAGDAT